MQLGFYFDQTRCIACNACTVSCKDYNQVNPGLVRWRKQENHNKKDGISVFENLTMSCNHCENPACIEACCCDAIKKRENGIVYVDRDLCEGAEGCIEACPFGAPHIADDSQEPIKKDSWKVAHPMQKCKGCWELVESTGQKPVCVQACPTRALDWDDITVLQEKYKDAVRLNPTDFPYAYVNNTTDTKPSFFIKKRRPLKITSLKK